MKELSTQGDRDEVERLIAKEVSGFRHFGHYRNTIGYHLGSRS